MVNERVEFELVVQSNTVFSFQVLLAHPQVLEHQRNLVQEAAEVVNLSDDDVLRANIPLEVAADLIL